MGLLLGMTLGAGLFCVWWSCWVPSARDPRGPSPLRRRVEDTLRTAGVSSASSSGLPLLVVACGVAALVAFGLVVSLSRSVPVALCFAVMAAWLPVGTVLGRARRRREQWRRLWPDVLDNLASAVRAGLSLPDALGRLAERGPEPLRPAFAAFARDYGVSANFGQCLDRLKDRLADPVGDRICEALRITREVGGSDLGTLLRNLSAFLREDARARSELEARQSWTVYAARLAVAAPWIVLVLLAGRPETLQAYAEPAGGVVLLTGALSTLVAYWLMLRVARLPAETRVLR
ncbi:type II secretion system F family protein [Spongisporangium articulatum]|uniref:Type II secretion system F family protein n=1 Tax=Spongisporangium articulatum TaxID=3362603 RepID=A0ABW8AJZ5_9ACTN